MISTGVMSSEQIQIRKELWIGISLSLVIHCILAAGWLSVMLAVSTQLATLDRLKNLPVEEIRQNFQKQNPEDPPLMFVEVTPEQAAAEAPKQAQFYSALNSKASNPEAEKETNVPRIQGEQDKIVKTFDTLHPRTEASPPAPPPEPDQKPKDTAKPEPTPQKNAPQDETKPEPTRKVGDLAFAKPSESKPPEIQPRPRPRTVVEAKLRQGIIQGEKMKQDGGVRNRGPLVAFDAKATTFGAYDEAIIAAVQRRWYDLLEDSKLPTRPGRVVITFQLHADGRITGLTVDEEDVGDILAVYCRRAISDPAPFAHWPDDMKRQIAKEYREIKFGFYYQ